MSSANDLNEIPESDEPSATDVPSQKSMSGENHGETGGDAGSDTQPEPAPPVEETPGEPTADTERAGDTERQLAERTADLQRLSAEYANYRRRAERDRKAATETAKASVVTELLGVLDDLDRARAHGDLETGPLKSVADKLSDVLRKQGLAEFGVAGESFDPTLHEAVQHSGSGADPVVDIVMRKGYRFGERVLRHALVGVCDGVSDLPDAASERNIEAESKTEGSE